MIGRSAETNLETYGAQEVVAHYAVLNYLTPCERMLFEEYIPRGSAILDLGVGGGRTTPYLSQRASNYVGVDYAEPMVKACRGKFPDLEFVLADAADLTAFSDASFDAVVFSFNGIDYVLPDDSRRICLQHIHRVLKAGGVLIFSTHNPRAILALGGWSRERLRTTARRLAADSKILCALLFWLLTSVRAVMAAGQTFATTCVRAWQMIPTRTFWRGEGNVVDPVHGGLLTHYSVPSRVISEGDALDFRVVRVVGQEYPRTSHSYATGWYYYVFVKPFEK